jgi:hypothetical protein
MKLPVPSVLGLSIALLSGCLSTTSADNKPHEMTDAERQAFRESWGSGAGLGAVSHPQSVAVTSGPAPLAYITDHAGEVWISDNTGRKWGPVPVAARTVVRVAEETGVAVGSVRLSPGPLPGGRTYTINIGLPEDHGWRNGTLGGPAHTGDSSREK